MSKQNRDAKKLANELILVSLVMVGLLLVWDAATRIDGFNERQLQLAEQSVRAASNELDTYITGYQRAVDIFAEENRFFLSNVELWPQDMELYSELKDKIDRFFPDNLSFTIADEHGQTLLEGMEALIGPQCRNDIEVFSRQLSGHLTYCHATPTGKYHHFDLMTHWEGSNSSNDIFFISVTTDRVKQILANANVLGHLLMLVRQDNPTRVDVIPDSDQPVLINERELSPAELRRVSESLPIDNTRWNVVSLPLNNLYSEAHRNILVRSILIFMGFVAVSALMRMILLDSDR